MRPTHSLYSCFTWKRYPEATRLSSMLLDSHFFSNSTKHSLITRGESLSSISSELNNPASSLTCIGPSAVSSAASTMPTTFSNSIMLNDFPVIVLNDSLMSRLSIRVYNLYVHFRVSLSLNKINQAFPKQFHKCQKVYNNLHPTILRLKQIMKTQVTIL